MILSLLLIFSLLCTLSTIYVFHWYQNITDFWILIVAFIAGFVIGVIILVLYILILALFANRKKECIKPKKIYLRTVQRVCEFLLMITRGKVYVRGIENIPADEKFLFVCNHQSWYDAIVSAWTLRAYPVAFVLKKSLCEIPILREFLHCCGYIALDRENAREGIKSINKCINKIQSNVSSIVIFPEGTRSHNYEMGEFHSGSFKIATKAKSPIVVCSMQNTGKVMKRFPFRSTNIYFDIIDVIKYDDYKDKTTQEISDYAHNLIEENLKNLPKY